MQVTMKNEPLSTNGEPPKVGEQLPDFKVKQADGSVVSVTELVDKPTRSEEHTSELQSLV